MLTLHVASLVLRSLRIVQGYFNHGWLMFLDTQSYVLNFHGRVTQASVKNFQVIHENDRK